MFLKLFCFKTYIMEINGIVFMLKLATMKDKQIK